LDIQDLQKDKQFQVSLIKAINFSAFDITGINHNIKLLHQPQSIHLFIKIQLFQLSLVKHFKSLQLLEKDKLKMKKLKLTKLTFKP
jgi:hypothetical protein